MRKATAIVMMILYMVPAIGIYGSVHYCGGQIASVSINGIGKSEKCLCGSKSMAKGCCNDEDFAYQLEEDQYTVAQFSIGKEKSIDCTLANPPDFICNYNSPFVEKEIYYAHHPPDIVKKPLYILHQVFII